MIVVINGDDEGGGDNGESDGATSTTSSRCPIKESDGTRRLSVEAKSFIFRPTKEGFSLIESHMRWKGVMSLARSRLAGLNTCCGRGFNFSVKADKRF